VLAPTVAYGQGGGMFYSGDNLTVVLFLAGFGVTFIMEGRKQRGWERRTLFCIGGVLLASATGWHWVKSLYQPLTGFLISLARNPETWLLLLVFAAIVIALGRKAPAEATPSAAPVTEQPPPLPLPRTKLTDFRWIDKQDVFTLHEASCYWAEEGLSGNDVKSPDAAGAWRMLNAAIVGKQLKAIEYSFGDMMSGRSTEARLTRVDLIVFATSKNERPRFLFPELREQGGKVAAPAPTAGISVSAHGHLLWRSGRYLNRGNRYSLGIGREPVCQRVKQHESRELWQWLSKSGFDLCRGWKILDQHLEGA
jgi:hypothetical protein